MKKIIIIGGGFAGAYCAWKLEKDFDVTLIDNISAFGLLIFFLVIKVFFLDASHIDKINFWKNFV